MTRPSWTEFRAGLAVICLVFVAGRAHAGDDRGEARDATAASIKAFVESQGKKVLTFAGYSGAQYEDPQAMLDQAARILDQHDPAKTLVNIGATEAGIGAVYELAKKKGFTTIGIVSSLARDERVVVSKHVDHVFFVKDAQWGGKVPGTNQLSPTSAALVECSSTCVAIGGGDVARDEMLAARQSGKSVLFIPADMNHRVAIEKARKNGQAAPTDFRGAAHAALAKGP